MKIVKLPGFCLHLLAIPFNRSIKKYRIQSRTKENISKDVYQLAWKQQSKSRKTAYSERKKIPFMDLAITMFKPISGCVYALQKNSNGNVWFIRKKLQRDGSEIKKIRKNRNINEKLIYNMYVNWDITPHHIQPHMLLFI